MKTTNPKPKMEELYNSFYGSDLKDLKEAYEKAQSEEETQFFLNLFTLKLQSKQKDVVAKQNFSL